LTLDLRPYSQEALSLIADRLSASLGIRTEQGVSGLLARASNVRPGGIAVLLRRLCTVANGDILTKEMVKEAFAAFGIARAIDTVPDDGAVNLANLSAVAFEKVIADLLGRMGFQTELTKASGDGRSTSLPLWTGQSSAEGVYFNASGSRTTVSSVPQLCGISMAR
jgi:hypothetical protein